MLIRDLVRITPNESFVKGRFISFEIGEVRL